MSMEPVFEGSGELMHNNQYCLLTSGFSMEEARHILGACGPEIDIIVAREPSLAGSTRPGAASPAATASGAAAQERRKRRKLPNIDRPQSAPIYKNVVTERTVMSGGDLTKTVIMIGESTEEEPGPGPGQRRSQSVQRRPSRTERDQVVARVSKSAERCLETPTSKEKKVASTVSEPSVGSGGVKKPGPVKGSKIPRRHQVLHKCSFFLLNCALAVLWGDGAQRGV